MYLGGISADATAGVYITHGSVFDSNQCFDFLHGRPCSGAGISVQGTAKVEISDGSVFSNQEAVSGGRSIGGAMYADQNTHMFINNSVRFENNSAIDSGGCFFLAGQASLQKLCIMMLSSSTTLCLLGLM